MQRGEIQGFRCPAVECLGDVSALPVNDAISLALCRRPGGGEAPQEFGADGDAVVLGQEGFQGGELIAPAVIAAVYPQEAGAYQEPHGSALSRQGCVPFRLLEAH